MDKGSVEIIGPEGIRYILINISKSIETMSTGVVTSYGLYILIGLLSYVSIMYLTSIQDIFIEFLLTIYAILNLYKYMSLKYR